MVSSLALRVQPSLAKGSTLVRASIDRRLSSRIVDPHHRCPKRAPTERPRSDIARHVSCASHTEWPSYSPADCCVSRLWPSERRCNQPCNSSLRTSKSPCQIDQGTPHLAGAGVLNDWSLGLVAEAGIRRWVVGGGSDIGQWMVETSRDEGPPAVAFRYDSYDSIQS